jgi:serine protease Do
MVGCVGARLGRVKVIMVCGAMLPLALAGVCVAQVVSLPTSDGTSTIDLANLQSQFRAVTNRVAQSVVAVSATVAGPDTDDAVRSDGMNGEKLDGILNRATRTVGTGFVIDAEGYLLTTEHVIGSLGPIWITTDCGKVYPAVVIGSDPRMDLAVLKIPASNMSPAKFALSQAPYRGMWTIALGNPYGLAGTGQMSMSVGVISATDRSLPKLASQENRYYSNLIQTTAEINPGNSGGPLFNLDGEVIGISTAVILPQKSTNGIGFAMPITPELLKRVQDLKEGREIVYAYLGVMVSTPTARQRRSEGIPENSGVVIDTVEEDSPASGVLQQGDVVLKISDQVVLDSDHFIRIVGQSSIAKPAMLAVRREGKPLTLTVRLRRRELPSVAVHRENQRLRWRGMLLGPIPTNWDFGPTKRPEHGLMVLGVDPASPLLRQGICSGAVITSVAGKPVNGITDLQTILNDTPAEQCSVELASQPQQAMVSGE